MEKAVLLKAYKKFELTKGRSPYSVFEFTEELEVEESEFYTHFSSLQQLKKVFLRQLVDNTLKALNEDENYASFSAREKLLALYFTLFEHLKLERSYLLHKYNSSDPRVLREFKDDWKDFFLQLNARVEQILMEARNEEEVVNRPYISDHYAKGFYLLFTYVYKVWLNDESDDFETTDAAIEKSVNLAFDLLGKGPLDAMLDFGKFALKTKVF
ncbi:TetR family transcriptional regulator C-terminal domain-containing protein [Lishizhenia tianjinensis]|nr:TetR family transcriptional regulator C-terminal domain-containing protein [Lishizhenia tianjinensis]